MYRFYLLLWISWLIRLLLGSLFLTIFAASVVTLFLYMKEGFVSLDGKITEALFDIFRFWFAVLWNISFLLALFWSLKYIFNREYGGYMIKLKECSKEGKDIYYIERIGYGDIIRVWRKWFMLLIWLVGSLTILVFVAMRFFTSYTSLFDWFSVYVLYFFILICGFFSFVVMTARCKSIKVVKC